VVFDFRFESGETARVRRHRLLLMWIRLGESRVQPDFDKIKTPGDNRSKVKGSEFKVLLSGEKS
jgi:hypothetical protein